MHLSFMPVEYRDFISGIQTTNHESYRNQRSDPKVIIPDTGHLNNQSPIRLVNAPMAHPSVIAMFRDAQYETFFESKKALEKGFALRARITENADTKRLPKSEAPWRQPRSLLIDKSALLPKTQNEPPKSTIPLRVPLDPRLVNPKAPQNAPDSAPPPRNVPEPFPRAAPQGADQGLGYVIDTKGGKGKRQPYEMASRFQPPQKSVRGGESSPSPWARSTMTMPTPPGVASHSSSTTPSAPQLLTELTPGQAGVPGYTGELAPQPLTNVANGFYKHLPFFSPQSIRHVGI
jgi:hypothetical protein